MGAEALKGHLDLLLLAAIAARPSHGYAIIDALRSLSHGTFDLPEGTVYPALHRLERAGLLESRWTEAGEGGTGRRRRVYEVSDRGRTALAARQREWHTFATGVGAVLEAAPWPMTA